MTKKIIGMSSLDSCCEQRIWFVACSFLFWDVSMQTIVSAEKSNGSSFSASLRCIYILFLVDMSSLPNNKRSNSILPHKAKTKTNIQHYNESIDRSITDMMCQAVFWFCRGKKLTRSKSKTLIRRRFCRPALFFGLLFVLAFGPVYSGRADDSPIIRRASEGTRQNPIYYSPTYVRREKLPCVSWKSSFSLGGVNPLCASSRSWVKRLFWRYSMGMAAVFPSVSIDSRTTRDIMREKIEFTSTERKEKGGL